MNYTFFAVLLCIAILAVALTCKKRPEKTFFEKVRTMMGRDEVGIETTTTTKKTISKL